MNRAHIASMALTLIACMEIHAQTLAVSSPSAAAGAVIAAEITITTPAGSPQPASLEWTVTFPSRDLTLIGDGPAIDPARQTAGKMLVCRGTWKKNMTYAYHCLLAGGVTPLADGPVAILRFQIRAGARPAVHPLELENLKAVTAGAKTTRLSGGNGSLRIVVSPI